MSNQRLPEIDSIQQLAKFWDTHDVTDFEEELEEVAEPVFERGTSITLRLQPHEAKTIHELAASKGLADAELLREWVLERIHTS